MSAAIRCQKNGSNFFSIRHLPRLRLSAFAGDPLPFCCQKSELFGAFCCLWVPLVANIGKARKRCIHADSRAFQSGSAHGIRTRVTALRGLCPRPLDERAVCRDKIYYGQMRGPSQRVSRGSFGGRLQNMGAIPLRDTRLCGVLPAAARTGVGLESSPASSAALGFGESDPWACMHWIGS